MSSLARSSSSLARSLPQPQPTPGTNRSFSSGQHLPVLDGLRTCAILLVMAFHFFFHRPLPTSAFWLVFAKASALGQTGVDLFFVLSGFLITGILLDTRNQPRALRAFYYRRTLRIFPLYYGYLIVAFLVLPALHLASAVPLRDQWWFWSYCQNIRDTFVSFPASGPGHFWSLAVEEHFYLVWPFLVFRFSPRNLIRVCYGIILLAVAVRTAFLFAGFPVFYFTLCRMDTLAFGALLAIFARQPQKLARLRCLLGRPLPWLGAALIPCYFVLTGTANPNVQIFKFTLIAAIFAAFLAFALTAPPVSLFSRTLGHPAATFLAKYSYALYVFHPVIFETVQTTLPDLSLLSAVALSFLATFAAAWCSWHLFEKWFLRLKHRSATASLQSRFTNA